MNFDLPKFIYPMKEYRPNKLPNPFTKYYMLGGVFLFILIFSILEENLKVRFMMLGVIAVLAVISFLIIRTVKYTILLRFENNALRIEYLDYRKKSFFIQIPYFELSAKISTESVKGRTYKVLKIARNGERKIRIDENTSNFSPSQLLEIYEDILKLNPLKG
jgi:hypothetical protein